MEIYSGSGPFRQATPAVRALLAVALLGLIAATAIGGYLLPLEDDVPLRALLAIIGLLGIAYILLIPPVFVGKMRLFTYAGIDFAVLTPREKVEAISAYTLRVLAILFSGTLFLAVAISFIAFLTELY